MLRVGALLALGGATGPLTGCDLFDGDEPDPAPDPLEPLAAEARELAARHRAALAADPGLTKTLTPIAEAHEAHAAELAKLFGRPASASSGTPSAGASAGGDRRATLTGLREAEQRGRESAAKLCAGAPAERAALLGSIAAARATHVEALK
ncbi:hypothetical protein [Micromonospora rubida]|uniref:hypothetical protein n=1 Tax=Micromonospora rubida TaxID=2697657 RepID=UPI00191C5AD8|nr:hypothetical protein [Micromonospora rubida]